MNENTKTVKVKKAVDLKLEFQLSERMKIQVNTDRNVRAVKVTYVNKAFMATGMMYDRKEIAKLIVALHQLI